MCTFTEFQNRLEASIYVNFGRLRFALHNPKTLRKYSNLEQTLRNRL